MYRSIRPADYDLLLRLDFAVYPTIEQVPKEVMDQWFRLNPQFGLVFEEGGRISGMNIVVPLSPQGWQALLSGVDERELSGDLIYDPERDRELGLYCYHIERIDEQPGFYMQALAALGEVVSSLRPAPRLLGYAAWAVTGQGIGLHYNKLNMREREHIWDGHIMSLAGEKEIVTDLSLEVLRQKLEAGYVYHNRCKLLVTYPGEASLVWQYLKTGS